MARAIPHPGQQHPEQWREDLNPTAMAGQNQGTAGPHMEDHGRTAYDIKDLHRHLHSFADDELKQIPVLPAGSPLEQGATYLDLRHPNRGEFTALGAEDAGPDNWYVLKSSVGYDLWNRLLEVGRAVETGAQQ